MTTSESKELKSVYVKKHVNTIHCSNNLTLVQRKLFNALLFNAYHSLPDKSQYEIPVKKLCELIGYDSRDYKKLRKSIIDLITTAIEWNVIDSENGEQQDEWRASAIISSAKIEKGVCTYEFSSIMRELLYRPEIYGKIDLSVMIEFKSGYGLALYENCVRFQGVSSTPWLPINIFRKLMGIADNTYPNFCDFKKRVLDIAIKEVNQHSPIKVTPEIQRVNKKVTNIKFKLSAASPKVLESSKVVEVSKNDNLITQKLKIEFGLSSEAVADILGKYGQDYVNEKVQLIQSSASFKSGRIRELAAYLIDAIKRDYKQSKSSANYISDNRSQDVERARKEKKRQEQESLYQNEQKRQAVEAYLDQLSSEEKYMLERQFEAYLQNHDNFYSFKVYKRSGLERKPIKALFNAYVLETILKKTETIK